MAKESKIEWTEATWNPWHGCHKVSQGCKNCYMFRDKARYGQDPNVVVRSKTKFHDPLKWTEPRTIFTCSWSDFFIEEADEWRDEAFAIMALTPHHTYQVLTKRPDRMLEYFNNCNTEVRIMDAVARLLMNDTGKLPGLKACILQQSEEWLPLPNVHLGVSVEDQNTADERIPLLLQTPAAVRWLSIEPLLGPVDLHQTCECCDQNGEAYHLIGVEGFCTECFTPSGCVTPGVFPEIDWVVAGGESGPDARPMHPDWPRSIRDQCTAAGVPFFFKQWGEWAPRDAWDDITAQMWRKGRNAFVPNFEAYSFNDDTDAVYRVGKKNAGRILDGRTWDEMPEVSR